MLEDIRFILPNLMLLFERRSKVMTNRAIKIGNKLLKQQRKVRLLGYAALS